MTPHRSNQRGTLKFDRRFGPIGRFNKASGTNDPKLFRRMDDMLSTLYETGRWDILRAMRAGWLKPLEVWNVFRIGQLDQLPTVEHVTSLRSTVDHWLARLVVSERHKASYRRLLNRMIEPKTTLRDLPALLDAFRARCEAKAQARTFNIARNGCKALLRDTVGRDDLLYRAINRVPKLQEHRRKGKKLIVGEVADITSRLGGYGAEWWALCLTGMRRGEYWGEWELASDRIVIHGTKTEAAERVVPLVFPIIRPRVGHWGFGRQLSKVTGGTILPHDARHTFIHWMDEAGIPRIRRMLYAGHRVGRDVTELYEVHDVTRHLSEDAGRLRLYIGEEPTASLRVV